VASSDFHKPKHLYSWKTLLKCEKTWPAVRNALVANVDVALTLFRAEAWAATAAVPSREVQAPRVAGRRPALRPAAS
jgi:hypothetical protein